MPKDTVVMAFSLSPRAAAYVRGAGQGRKSALVDRCILYYKDNRVQDLLDQIAFMEGNIAGLQSKLLNDPQPLGVEEDKTEVPKGQSIRIAPGRRGISIFYVLTYPLQLLKDRLLFRDSH